MKSIDGWNASVRCTNRLSIISGLSNHMLIIGNLSTEMQIRDWVRSISIDMSLTGLQPNVRRNDSTSRLETPRFRLFETVASTDESSTAAPQVQSQQYCADNSAKTSARRCASNVETMSRINTLGVVETQRERSHSTGYQAGAPLASQASADESSTSASTAPARHKACILVVCVSLRE